MKLLIYSTFVHQYSEHLAEKGCTSLYPCNWMFLFEIQVFFYYIFVVKTDKFLNFIYYILLTLFVRLRPLRYDCCIDFSCPKIIWCTHKGKVKYISINTSSVLKLSQEDIRVEYKRSFVKSPPQWIEYDCFCDFSHLIDALSRCHVMVHLGMCLDEPGCFGR